MQTFYVGLLFKLNFNKASGRVFMCGRRSKRLSPTCLVFDTVDAREVFRERFSTYLLESAKVSMGWPANFSMLYLKRWHKEEQEEQEEQEELYHDNE